MDLRPFTQQQCHIINMGCISKFMLTPQIHDEIILLLLLAHPKTYAQAQPKDRTFRFNPLQMNTPTSEAALSPKSP